MKKRNLEIKKLGYPLWFHVLFFLLTVVVPIALIAFEGLKAPATPSGSAFKVSFIGLSLGIFTWFFAKRFLIKNWEAKLISSQAALEHDYSIQVGNPELTKYHWYSNESKLSIINMINVLLYGGLTFLIMLGVSSALIEIKHVVLIVTGLYVIAFTIKFVFLTMRSGTDV